MNKSVFKSFIMWYSDSQLFTDVVLPKLFYPFYHAITELDSVSSCNAINLLYTECDEILTINQPIKNWLKLTNYLMSANRHYSLGTFHPLAQMLGVPPPCSSQVSQKHPLNQCRVTKNIMQIVRSRSQIKRSIRGSLSSD